MARLKDIAQEAGVSISTVSRVLNHDSNFSVSFKNRQKILQIAEKLQYPVSELRSKLCSRTQPQRPSSLRPTPWP